MNLFKWLHHLTEPHCSECKIELECKNCEVLKLLLEQERAEKTRLIHMLVPDKESPPAQHDTVDFNKLMSKSKPWKVRQQELEAQARIEANIKQLQMEKIEKEVGIE